MQELKNKIRAAVRRVNGRLKIIEKIDDIRNIISVSKNDKKANLKTFNQEALKDIVNHIISIVKAIEKLG